MASFYPAHKNTSTNEGGYSNNRADRGGETYKGIARKFHEDWEGWIIINEYKARNNFPDCIPHERLEPLVDKFYKAEFWDKIKGDDIPQQEIANYLYDIAVNKHWKPAVRYLQRGCNLSNRQGKDWPDLKKPLDGLMGDKTLAALKSWTDLRGSRPCKGWLFVKIMSHWEEQALEFPGQETFINGIMDRNLRQLFN